MGITFGNPRAFGELCAGDRSGMGEDESRHGDRTAVMVGLITAPVQDADRIAGTLVAERLAACCNVLPSVVSHFRWEGARKKQEESLIIFKTTRAASQALISRVKEVHPYDLPEVLLFNACDGLEGYLKWVTKECSRWRKGA